MPQTKKDDILINKLLEETYSFVPQSDVARSANDLYKYFVSQTDSLQKQYNCHLHKYISDVSSTTVKIDWMEQTSCYRFELQDQLIDIPSNWGPFANFDVDSSSVLYIKTSEDEFLLNEVISSLIGRNIESVFFVDSHKVLHLSLIEIGVDADLDKIIELASKWSLNSAA